MLKITKTFVRRITLGTQAYLVEQNKKKCAITITHKKTQQLIYVYNAPSNSVEYDEAQKELIEIIMERAHIDRYML